VRIQHIARAIAPALLAAWLPLAAAAGEEPTQVKQITPAELHARQARHGVLVIDVRTPAEFAAGHIPGARNMPHTEFENLAGMVAWSGAEDVVVYCMKGPRARLAEAELVKRGVPGLAHLEGGFLAWSEAGLPVEGAAAQ
jgi:rhodanese-related sulfurtransferase